METRLTVFVVACLVILFIKLFLRNRGIRKATKNYQKALMRYQNKDYLVTVVLLDKAIVLPHKGKLSFEEAQINVKILELLDLVLLNSDVDGDVLTLQLRCFLSAVKSTAKVDLDKGYFSPILLFFKKYIEDQSITQKDLKAIAMGDFRLKSQVIVNSGITLQALRLGKVSIG